MTTCGAARRGRLLRLLRAAIVPCALAAWTGLGGVAHADEGMWTFDNFPSQAVKAKFGVTIDDDPQRICISNRHRKGHHRRNLSGFGGSGRHSAVEDRIRPVAASLRSPWPGISAPGRIASPPASEHALCSVLAVPAGDIDDAGVWRKQQH